VETSPESRVQSPRSWSGKENSASKRRRMAKGETKNGMIPQCLGGVLIVAARGGKTSENRPWRMAVGLSTLDYGL